MDQDQIKFKSKTIENEQGCWVWNLSKNGAGRGAYVYKGRSCSANFCSWLLFNGDASKDYVAVNICKNNSCVNPKHLKLITRVENIRNKIREAWEKRYLKITHCKKGHKYTFETLRIDAHGNRSCRVCEGKIKNYKKKP